MRIMVVGGSGYLGGEVVRRAAAAGADVLATRFSGGSSDDKNWRRLDVRLRHDVDAMVAGVRPDVIVNAAYVKDDWATTADGAGHVALAAARQNVRLVHVSSDSVFDSSDQKRVEGDPPCPTTTYGAAKAAAETAVCAIHPEALIARTSLILGDGRSVHEAFIRELIYGPSDRYLYTDDVKCPVHVADLAAALLEFASSEHAGLMHVAGRDAVSRAELGRLIAERDGLHTTFLRSGRRPDRPYKVLLDSSAAQRILRTRLRGAREFLELSLN